LKVGERSLLLRGFPLHAALLLEHAASLGTQCRSLAGESVRHADGLTDLKIVHVTEVVDGSQVLDGHVEGARHVTQRLAGTQRIGEVLVDRGGRQILRGGAAADHTGQRRQPQDDPEGEA
jgi:hypothetical protein